MFRAILKRMVVIFAIVIGGLWHFAPPVPFEFDQDEYCQWLYTEKWSGIGVFMC